MAVQALTREDRVVTTIVYFVLSLVFVVVGYPLYFVVIASVSNPTMVATGNVWWIPRGISFDGYARIFNHQEIMSGYRNSVVYAVLGTSINLFLTLTAGYALSRRDMIGRNAITFVFAFTMFFSGGLIPLFLLVRNLGLLNTIWAMVLPSAMSVWNLVIARTFFQSTIPGELLDAAVIDGCSDLAFFWRIVLPLSSAIIAVLTIFYAVGHWNAYFHALVFLRSRDRFPLQLVLRDILIQSQFGEDMQLDGEGMERALMIAESIKYGVIIVASLPVLILYPIVQKHFVRGIMIGAIKG